MAENTTTAGLSQDYIDALSGEYNAAENCYNEYHKASQKAEEEYLRAVDWENCIKDFLDKLTSTYDKANELDSFIQSFIDHGKKVCSTVGYAKQATQILVECMRCLSEDNEILKKALKDLLEIIDCLNDPILDSNVSIMKCLNEFKTKIDEGIVANLAAIKELLVLIQCILELEYELCKPGDPASMTMQGLLNDLERLKTILDCSYPHGEPVSDVDCTAADEAFPLPAPGTCTACVDACGGEVNATPHDTLCEYTREDIKPKYCEACGNHYKVKLQGDYRKASEQRCYAKCVLDHFQKLEKTAKSNRDATKAALDAAEAAKAKC